VFCLKYSKPEPREEASLALDLTSVYALSTVVSTLYSLFFRAKGKRLSNNTLEKFQFTSKRREGAFGWKREIGQSGRWRGWPSCCYLGR
jgi:hypothetical protein